MAKTIIKNATLVNEGRMYESDVLVDKGRIIRIDKDISDEAAEVIDIKGQW
ncbi:MAG: dihydroorotase, partial [Saprospiraceae bacterium]|nr:dihydroorotase [Saprospiraceae bacterium]